jgi:hypothetical protein
VVVCENLVVDPHNDRGVELVLGGSAQNHPLGAGFDVPLKAGPVGESPGRFEDDLASQLLPGQ